MRKSLLLCMFLFCGFGLTAQTLSYEYVYDQTGNRIRRSIVRLSKELNKGDDNNTSLSFVEELSDGSRMTLYPNPTKGIVRFEKEHSDDVLGQFRLFDTKGRLIKEGFCENNNFELDLSDQPNGIYLIEFRNKEKQYTNKIIKE